MLESIGALYGAKVTMSTWKEGFRRIARDRSITGEALRVLLVVLSSIEEGYFSSVTPREIGQILNVHDPSVRRAVRCLVEKGVMRKRYESEKLVGFEVVEHFGAKES
jgi:DNA-binding MarR family transcriptional regulator